MQMKAERLAYWYLRLNGYLTIPNFIVHPDPGMSAGQRTDVDVLGVRFPHRCELLVDPMEDDPEIVLDETRPVIVIAEVKGSGCELNGPWTRRNDENIQRVIRAVGAFSTVAVDGVSAALYERGRYEDEQYVVSLVCIGSERNRRVESRYPCVPQVTWINILAFIHGRFSRYYDPKRAHPQWDEDGKRLWRAFENHRMDLESFKKSVEIS